MGVAGQQVVVGLDVGGTSCNATVLTAAGEFLVDQMFETPSRVTEGPAIALDVLAQALAQVLTSTGIPLAAVAAVGLDTPGPASPDGVLSTRGATNFGDPAWHGFDFRGGLAERLALPVIYLNDANAAALYAHQVHFGLLAPERSSVAAVVGTGLGGGLVDRGQVVTGVAGQAGELGHVHIPMTGLLAEDQPVPRCNCGFQGDAESVASLTGIVNNLLPYWLTRYPDHDLAKVTPVREAAKQVRRYAEKGDRLALQIFEQQAIALGRLFTIVANMTDPHAYFVGGGVVEAAPHFRDWFLATVREHTVLRDEQAAVVEFALVPHRDMAGARGAALAAWSAVASAG
ncbi:ROK family protein [Natronosporangium hydrolyticum]|uniref:ROK family protein n=1 Tax=Natronosporangium hydrolyticum TaxID=2811111 RepID=A0A895YE67_9ACTN|nr:ROK family protein [Natronosporangium hydrolyticum]QSB13699.1 ROK family protein [Natronosporangium hydrolyticum]